MLDTADILAQLCSLPGPSGFEEAVAGRARELLSQFMDETWIDVMGNVIGVRRCGKSGAGTLLFDAHIDETGLIITGSEEGFLRFAALGGTDPRILPASCVLIQTEPPLYGIICALPPHVIEKGDTEKTIKIEDMFIDIGLAKEAAEKAVPPGVAAVLAHSARRLGESGLCGKALDNRAGFCAILRALELLRNEPLDVDLFVMASVQEEVGTRGAAPGVYAIAPDRCVVVDAGHAKTPDSKPDDTATELGRGVIISRGPNMNSRFTEEIVKIALKNEIKHQIDVEPGGDSGTNTRPIQISRVGVATALFSIPVKYMHSAYEALESDDIEDTAKLLCETAKAACTTSGKEL
ncbi:MAG: M42 family peptidase [Oscillospiraceae bacterium]|jgi:endoglucanase|nr:M42 family peptidase [Oscillospiraceae bacterium]